jgi:hypothetical protein
MVASVLTPLQMIAGASLMQNQGLVQPASLTTAITNYNSIPLILTFRDTVIAANGVVTGSTYVNLKNVGNTTCPALADSVPSAYTSILTYSNTNPGLSGIVSTQSLTDFGSGDYSKLCQAISAGLGYAQTTNEFINSAVNSQDYLANTFTSMNDTITGGLSGVSSDLQLFASDLEKLGRLIDLSTLDDLGAPLNLLRNVIKVTGNIPALAIAFVNAGIQQEIVVNLNNPNLSVTDTVQKQLYNAMTTITGNTLDQILKVLRCTTPNIETMADLLNPVKIFPNSYMTLTAPTKNGLTPIYTNTSGSVNQNLATELPPYVLSNTV